MIDVAALDVTTAKANRAEDMMVGASGQKWHLMMKSPAWVDGVEIMPKHASTRD
jgi:hypothetical protein